MNEKYNALMDYLSGFDRLAVAFSGGIDSAFLLNCAKNALGDRAVAITANLRSLPKKELDFSIEYCQKIGVKQIVADIDELTIDGFAENPKDRCYICKKAVFGKLLSVTAENNITALAEGSNVDDTGDYRPGLRAITELAVLSPLKTVGFTKAEIRQTAKELNISIWNKASSACLSSRFAYGEKITAERLKMVENSEQYLAELGFCQFRVRVHNSIARIEVQPQQFELLLENRSDIYKNLKGFGFDYITMDLLGYRVGSMNEIIRR